MPLCVSLAQHMSVLMLPTQRCAPITGSCFERTFRRNRCLIPATGYYE
jgi:hypothetical protein